ncbi:MAG TPA: ABC transporter permease [Symbiobacteriaceae bacterium]|jgi:ABC-2 type transport system permease protein
MWTLHSLKQMTLFQFRSLLRNKTAFFFSLINSVVLVAVFGAAYGNMGSNLKEPVGVVDLDRGPVAQAARTALANAGVVDMRSGDEAAMKALLVKGTVRAVIILPAGLSDRVAAGQPAAVTVLRDPSSNASSVAIGVMANLIQGYGLSLAGARPVLYPNVQDLPGLDRFNFFDFMMPGQLVYMLLAGSFMSIAIMLAGQRVKGTLRHLFSTPLSMSLWVTTQVLANLLLAALQIVVLFAAAWLMFRVHLPASIPGTAVLLTLSALAALGMGLLVGSWARSGEVAFPVAFIIFFAVAMLGNAMMPIDGAPDFMLALQKFMPSTYMTHALKLVMMQGKSLLDVWKDMAVIGATALVTGSLAVWRMRRQMTAA